MRKINKILQYNFSNIETEHLIASWIANWCWWKWWISFGTIVRDNIASIPWFDKDKFWLLWDDIPKICIEHDFDYRIQAWFIRSNYRMWKKLYKLLKRWAWKRKAFWIWLIVFTLLSKYWKKYYNNSIKK